MWEAAESLERPKAAVLSVTVQLATHICKASLDGLLLSSLNKWPQSKAIQLYTPVRTDKIQHSFRMAEKVRAALKVNFYFKFFFMLKFLYRYVQNVSRKIVRLFLREKEIYVWKVILKDGCEKIWHLGFFWGVYEIEIKSILFIFIYRHPKR